MKFFIWCRKTGSALSREIREVYTGSSEDGEKVGTYNCGKITDCPYYV